MRLKDKVALIIGLAVGIGRAEAYLFSAEGAKIAGADINDAGGEETVATIKARGGEAVYFHTDVTKAAEVKKLVEQTMAKFGRIDIVINDAGIPQALYPVEDTDEALWNRIHDVNLKSVFLVTKYVVPYMKKAGGGVIINTATMSALRPHAGHCALTSAKNSVIALTRGLARELAPDKIRVNCVSPWNIETPSFRSRSSGSARFRWGASASRRILPMVSCTWLPMKPRGSPATTCASMAATASSTGKTILSMRRNSANEYAGNGSQDTQARA
jgi:3-oxoacyl-[acyl-carrier protein] reductase